MIKQITRENLGQLASKAEQSPRLRTNLNLHPDVNDPVQRLAVTMEPQSYVRIHRHPHTWELLSILSGRLVVLIYNSEGKITERLVLGEETRTLEIPAGIWHSAIALDKGTTFLEIKQGPYVPVPEEDTFSGSPAEGDDKSAAIMAWYPDAKVGDTVKF
ncbi:WbuC family cupin fold metalloprotein [Rouxiella sp. WC2420]|uniref:WbuC family cupin fold metalloprotein n=1 Tax=Rouxiella sp. WC2420 TaxID=3234145 RepID=A0AB39VRI0_9GAMM